MFGPQSTANEIFAHCSGEIDALFASLLKDGVPADVVNQAAIMLGVKPVIKLDAAQVFKMMARREVDMPPFLPVTRGEVDMPPSLPVHRAEIIPKPLGENWRRFMGSIIFDRCKPTEQQMISLESAIRSDKDVLSPKECAASIAWYSAFCASPQGVRFERFVNQDLFLSTVFSSRRYL
jgi:hypothetical protein